MTRRRRLDMAQIVEMASSTAKLCDVLVTLAPEVPEFSLARKVIQDGARVLTEQEKHDTGGGR